MQPRGAKEIYRLVVGDGAVATMGCSPPSKWVRIASLPCRHKTGLRGLALCVVLRTFEDVRRAELAAHAGRRSSGVPLNFTGMGRLADGNPCCRSILTARPALNGKTTGRVLRVSGNPYHPLSAEPALPPETSSWLTFGPNSGRAARPAKLVSQLKRLSRAGVSFAIQFLFM